MDSLTAMEVLVRVVETGSFSGAARLLRVGQPAVSKTIAQLEERLGVQPAAQVVARAHPDRGRPELLRARQALDRGGRRGGARGARRGHRSCGPVALQLGRHVRQAHIIPRLPLFLAAHPELTVEAILDDRDVDLIEEGIDVGFLMGMLADSTMVARKIGQSRRLVLGTPSYFEKAGSRRRRLSWQIIRL